MQEVSGQLYCTATRLREHTETARDFKPRICIQLKTAAVDYIKVSGVL